jgi:hypothetical protein
MAILFIPQPGFTWQHFAPGMGRCTVTRANSNLVHYRSEKGSPCTEGTAYWNSHVRIAGMATERDLGYR